jgi:hypothetical protein
MDEAHARARLDALIAEHGLPEPERTWLSEHDADFLRVCPSVDPTTVQVRLCQRSDLTAWAQALAVPVEISHHIHEYEDQDRRWCAVWSEVVVKRGWLPGVKLRVHHTEDRWIDAPAVTR